MKIRRNCFSMLTTHHKRRVHTLETIGLSISNSIRFLKQEIPPSPPIPQIIPRPVRNCHFVNVFPEPVPSPYFVAASSSCADAIGLDRAEMSRGLFVEAFSGNKLLPGLDEPYCTIYGCHSYGQWFGQLGDGRAMSLGDVKAVDTRDEGTVQKHFPTSFELQLKGCGRSPFSRGFDGRAVLRSSIREYLASEAMHHLGVPTTRALCVIGTGQTVARPWYPANMAPIPTDAILEELNYTGNGGGDGDGDGDINNNRAPPPPPSRKKAPQHMVQEPGAIVCRVSPSFLRFSQLELHSQRQEYVELIQLAEYICAKDFPHLVYQFATKFGKSMNSKKDQVGGSSGSLSDNSEIIPTDIQDLLVMISTFSFLEKSQLFVALFEASSQANAFLVSEWLRVGYVQGNMNSDNTLVAGRTLDYGPFGFMESFDPSFQPFTSDPEGNFCFSSQPEAMGVNIETMGKSIEVLVRYCQQMHNETATAAVDSNGSDAIEEAEESNDANNNNNNRKDENPVSPISDRAALARFLAASSAASDADEKFADCISAVNDIIQTGFKEMATQRIQDMRRRKLGFRAWKASDASIWTTLEQLLQRCSCDYTIFFRSLCEVSNYADMDGGIEEAINIILPSMYSTNPRNANNVTVTIDRPGWSRWLTDYFKRIQEDGMPAEERRSLQRSTNPKYVLRNWMSAIAYERAALGDYSIVNELTAVLSNPYEDQTAETSNKWYRKTPIWAQQLPGVTFMSCSS